MFIAKVLNVWADETYMDNKGKFMLNSSGLVGQSLTRGIFYAWQKTW